MTRDKGNRAPEWCAAWLHPWFPDAAKTPNSRPGRDIENTPGVAIEVKTGAEWRPNAWTKQAEKYAAPGELPLLWYIPPSFGERAVGEAMFIVRPRLLVPVLVEAGYFPRAAGRPMPGGPALRRPSRGVVLIATEEGYTTLPRGVVEDPGTCGNAVGAALDSITAAAAEARWSAIEGADD